MYRPFTLSKMSWLRGSRRNACTARMPPSDSVNCTIVRATASRLTRYAFSDSFRNHTVSTPRGTKPASASSPSGVSSHTRIAPVVTIDSPAYTSVFMPVSSSSEMASMSEVSRDTTRPDV